MFTGIIEALGRITAVRPSGAGSDLEIEVPEIARHLTLGQSVAVSGVCLTVTQCGARRFSATAVGETMRRTILGFLRVGAIVNIERGLALGERLDGHLVQGHVDGVGAVSRIERTPPGMTLHVELDRGLMHYVAPKGSVAVDGVSLTVAEISDAEFSIAVIPHTLEVTTLGERKAGDRVNIEVDLLARYLARLLAREDTKGEERAYIGRGDDDDNA